MNSNFGLLTVLFVGFIAKCACGGGPEKQTMGYERPAPVNGCANLKAKRVRAMCETKWEETHGKEEATMETGRAEAE